MDKLMWLSKAWAWWPRRPELMDGEGKLHQANTKARDAYGGQGYDSNAQKGKQGSKAIAWKNNLEAIVYNVYMAQHTYIFLRNNIVALYTYVMFSSIQ